MKRFRRHNRHFRKRSLVLSALLLLALSFLTSWYFNSTLSVGYQQKSLQRYLRNQQEDARQVLRNTTLMSRLVQHKETEGEFKRLTQKQWGLFLFVETLSDNPELLFWNSQKFIQPEPEFNTSTGISFDSLRNGFFVVQKEKLVLPGMTNNMIVYVMIPVLHKYFIQTEVSQTAFAHDGNAHRKIALTREATSFPIKSFDGQTLFYVKQVNTDAPVGVDTVSLIFRLTALLFLLIALHLLAEGVVRKRGAVQGVLFLLVALLAVRVLLYWLPAFLPLRQVPIFDPSIYGSDYYINSSLGHLLLNAIFLCWIILFAWNRMGPVKELPRFLKRKGIIAAGVAGIFLLMLVTFQLANLVYGLVVDSRISFEVTNFPKLSAYTTISFVILALLSLSYYYFSRLLFRFILMAFPSLPYLYFTVAIVGLFVLTFWYGYKEVLFYLPVLGWLVFYTLVLTQEQAIINRFRVTIAGLLFWIFIFSISLAGLIMQGNREREHADNTARAIKLDEESDPSKRNVLSIALGYLDNRFLITNFPRFYQKSENQWIRDSITSASLANYKRAYNSSIYVFDRSGKEVNNPDPPMGFEELNNVFTVHSTRTRSKQPDIVYYETSPTRFVYLIRKQVFDSTKFVGTFFLIATPKQFQEREAFYPDIFNQEKDRFDDPSVVSAIYQNYQLVHYNGNYSFKELLNMIDIPDASFSSREKEEYNELWYKVSNNKIIIVARKKDTLIESITLFSYLFCAFLFMVGTIRLFEFMARVARNWPQADIFSRLSIRSQIHVTIIFISVLSFFVIGVATIAYFMQRNKRDSMEFLHRTATNTLSEVKQQFAADSLLLNAQNFTDPAAAIKLERIITDVADVHGRIVNIYDQNGALKITSDKNIYQRGVLSTKMDPVAFYHLKTMGEVQRTQDEYFGNLRYQSFYKAIWDTGHKTFAYLNIPYFESGKKLDQEISNFLVTIINLNAFIVLIAGVIALFITNRITRSFSVISNKMKEISLNQTNEEITWTKDDEIGELVKQYNKMVRQLEESASALAKSEREGAWREMARQVAHEIKNPLTPMKLSIQYLQKAIQNNQPNVKDLTTSVASTLIEQIDHLSKIAADFSQFANIGNKRVEEINLHNVISSLLDLYSTNPKVEVTWNPVLVDAVMRADKTHMNRLFTNLLTNAVDACSERGKCLVVISEKLVNNDLLISITDNGDGIPADIQAKIFTPNFTTKTSGTGLGLAMCKGIVEQAGGDIWFQTKEGEGTTFFVQLPLVVSSL